MEANAFDILALDGDDLRKLRLSLRKRKLERLLKLRPNGIFIAPFEQGEIGPDLFTAACNWGLEGLVSKRADRPYRAGQSKDWVKIKNAIPVALEAEAVAAIFDFMQQARYAHRPETPRCRKKSPHCRTS